MSPDPYETLRPKEYWADMQESALDNLGFDWSWYRTSKVTMCRRRVVPSDKLEEANKEIARLKARIVEMEKA